MSSYESVLDHRKKGIFLVIRHEYLQLCRFNFCAAALITVFENWTNWTVFRVHNEAERFREDPIVTISLSHLRSDMLGMYSRSSVSRSLDWLIDQKMIIVIEPPDSKSPGRYLLNCDLINGLLKKYRNEDIPDRFGEDFGEDPGPGGGGSKLNSGDSLFNFEQPLYSSEQVGCKTEQAAVQFCTPYKEYIKEPEYQLKTSNSEYVESSSATFSQDQETLFNLDDFKLFWRRRRGFKKLKTAEIERAEKVLCNSKYTASQIHGAVEVFGDDDFWKDKGFPLAGFLSQLDRFVEASGDREHPPETPIAPGAFVRAPAVSLPAPVVEPIGLPPRVEEWNQIAPQALRVSCWSKHDPARELLDAESDPVFRENFPAICRRAVEIGKGSKGVLPTFQWLFQKASKSGKPNWYQVYSGAYNWALPVDANAAPPGKAPTPSEIGRKVLADLHAKIAAKKEAAGNGI